MAGTATAFIAWLRAQLGKTYSETAEGGTGPDDFDCSGLMEVGLNDIGIPYTRSTYTQWGDKRYQHFGPYSFGQLAALLPLLQIGDILYIHVEGEEDPGHVGCYIGNGQYLNAPHSGAVVRIEAIPNTASEHVWGVIRPPYGAATTSSAPAQPAAPPQEVIDLSNFPGAISAESTASGKGAWVVTANGNVYTTGDAQEYGTLTTVGVKNVTNIVGIFRSFTGNGYYLLGSDGGVFAFGDAKVAPSPSSYPGLPAADRQGDRSFGVLKVHFGGNGYTLIALDGSFYSFGS